MNSESALISAVENYPYPANFKEADSGRYVVCNTSNARQLGMADSDSVVGLTIRDMRYARTAWGGPHADIMVGLDFQAREKKILVTSRQAVLDADGDVRFEEVTKSPVLGHTNNVLGIISFQSDLTSTLSLCDVYGLYRSFYRRQEAIQRMLGYLGVENSFSIQPTDAHLKVFLGKVERLSSKEIAKNLGISHRTVECHVEALGNRTMDGDLRRVLALVKRRA